MVSDGVTRGAQDYSGSECRLRDDAASGEEKNVHGAQRKAARSAAVASHVWTSGLGMVDRQIRHAVDGEVAGRGGGS